MSEKGEEEEMPVTADIKIDVQKSIEESLNEVQQIMTGKKAKNSYKDMMKRVREELAKDE